MAPESSVVAANLALLEQGQDLVGRHSEALVGQPGVDPGPEFGVAPSTLRHWSAQAACAPQSG